jgi:hypothetical protein
MMSGYVYLMEMGEYYKIGQTIDVPGRLLSLDVGPLPLRLVHSFASHDAKGDEAFLHQKHAAKRVRREWFRLEVEDVEAFCRIQVGPIQSSAPLVPPPPLPTIRVSVRATRLEREWARRKVVGDRILACATNAGLSAADVAERTGISLESVEAFIAGQREPGGLQRDKLARLFGIRSAALLRPRLVDVF